MSPIDEIQVTAVRSPTSASLVMPLFTQEQFYDLASTALTKLKAIFELADNVEHVALWSAPRVSDVTPPPSFHGQRGERYYRQGNIGPKRFTGWEG